MSRSADFLMVRLGDRRIGLPIDSVIAVEAVGLIYPIPTSDPCCRGVTNARGRLMPVLSLRVLIETDSGEGGGTAIVIDLGGKRLCLEVDDAEAIVHGELLPLPPGESLPWASAVVRRPEGLVPLLDLAALGERLTIVEASP
jgi:chemotaxis signal transduction protein